MNATAVDNTKECIHEILGVSIERCDEIMEAVNLGIWELQKPGLPEPKLGDFLSVFLRPARNEQELVLQAFVCSTYLTENFDYTFGDAAEES